MFRYLDKTDNEQYWWEYRKRYIEFLCLCKYRYRIVAGEKISIFRFIHMIAIKKTHTKTKQKQKQKNTYTQKKTTKKHEKHAK